MPGFEDAGLETAQAVLEECAKFNQDVIAPLNWEGDKNPSAFARRRRQNRTRIQGSLRTIRARAAGKVCNTPQILVGRACPKPLVRHAVRCSNSANMSFALCPLLTDGAIEALLTAGSDELKAYLP
jgi:hypothetical protein